MTDYSNLLRGGGVSSTARSGDPKGKSRIFIFITLCCIVLLGIWIYNKATDDSDGDSTAASADTNPEITSETYSTKPVTTITKSNKTYRKTEKMSISPKALMETQQNLAKAEQYLKNDEYILAQKLFRKIMNSGLKEGSELWDRAASLIGDANIKIYMSDIPAPNKKLYTIQEGDTLIAIAKRFKTTVESIQKSNGLDPASQIIFPGKTLYIYTGKWSIKVSKEKFKLYLYDGSSIFKIYNVGIGRQGRTPSGLFQINIKQKEPVWYNEGTAIPYGSKSNVLGTRWLAMKPIGETNKNLRGYGIHGTWKPETIGTKASNGCIRMKNNEVNELYSIIPYRTEVTITD